MINVSDSSQTRSAHGSETFNVGHDILREVRELTQESENHPDRHALQQDIVQIQSFNRFNLESKQMIQDVGNIELCELFEMEPKSSEKSTYHTGIPVSKKGTGGMESSVVLLKPRIHLFACTHLSVANAFDWNDLLILDLCCGHA